MTTFFATAPVVGILFEVLRIDTFIYNPVVDINLWVAKCTKWK